LRSAKRSDSDCIISLTRRSASWTAFWGSSTKSRCTSVQRCFRPALSVSPNSAALSSMAWSCIRGSGAALISSSLCSRDVVVVATLVGVPQQVVEQGAVVHHGLAQVLGRRLPTLAAFGDRVGAAVVVHHAGVLDRKIGGLLLEVTERVATLCH